MKRLFGSFLAVVAAGAVSARADSIHLQYTTFGGNTPTTEGPLTPDMGTAVVNGNSAILTSNNAEVGAVWMDTALNTQANFVSLQFDINVLAQAASGYGQAFPQNSATQTLGGVRIVQNGVFAESFQLMPTSTTTGYFAFRNADNTDVQMLGTYDTNTVYHIELDADYVAGTASAYINGTLANPVGYPLRTGTGPGGTTGEIFVYLNGASGQDVHNSFEIGDTVAAPLPSTTAMGSLGLAAVGVGGIVRKRRRASTASA